MISLLDASVLIALFDAAHVHHRVVHEWMANHRAAGWATCPLTQNACIRIMSQPAYPGRLSVMDITRRLRQAISTPDHSFWSDSISLCDEALFDHRTILTPKYLTDLYLLALAVKSKGRLVTLDQGISFSKVRGASEQNLLIL